MSGIYYSSISVDKLDIEKFTNEFVERTIKNDNAFKLSEYMLDNAVIEIKEDVPRNSYDYKMSVAIMSPEEYKRLKEIERIFYKYTDLEFLLLKENKQ